jgi:HEAT repeat protein
MQTARRVLLQSLDRPPTPEDTKWLGSLPVELQFRLFEEIAPSLRGVGLLRVRELAQSIRLIDRARASCRSRRWWIRLRGARAHTLLGGGEQEMPALLTDPVPEVRAQAAEWAAEHPSGAVIERLLELLDDDEQIARFTVEDSLIRLGGAVSPALAAYLIAGRPGLVPALRVARFGPDPRYLPGALRASTSPDPLARSEAALLLGALGGEGVVGRLIEMIADEDLQVRSAAVKALGQMGHWPAASAIAGRLTDPAWDVRRAAGLALRTLGAPGTLFLRKALKSEDRFAADMAAAVLGLPGFGSTGMAL